jgi:serralysin
MSGTGTTTSVVTATGDQYIDGLLSGTKWADAVIHYSFSKTSAAYSYTSGTDVPADFRVFTAAQETAAEFALDGSQNAAAAGFSIAGFTLANIQGRGEVDSTSGTNVRLGGTTSSTVQTSEVADFPGNNLTADMSDNGDVWMGSQYDGTIYDSRAPVAGNYAWIGHIHEIGHAMGLKHPHEDSWSFGAVPLDEDSMEFSVMSYRSYYNASTLGGWTNEQWSYAQSYMMLDIAALQAMYGANYTTNSGDTVYKWTPDSGNTVINGSVAIEPGANRIFATIWDGGGNDTYDLSAYTSGLGIDLRPGKWSVFDSDQLADLGDGHTARGSIFNALEYHGNQASEIENAIGGSGDDTITGNDIANVLTGNGGADTLTGGAGADALVGGDGTDTASYSTAAAGVTANLAAPAGNTGDAAGDSYDSIENLVGSAFDDSLTGDGNANALSGGAGNDMLTGGAGADALSGGDGTDTASYATAAAGVTANLAAPAGNTGDAAGDTYDSIENLVGSAFADSLTGDGNANTLTGGAGGDALAGGGGTDTASYSTAAAGVTASLATPAGNTGDAAGDTYDSIENLVGSAFADSLTGDGNANGLDGGSGNDILTGGAGADALSGGAGTDTASYATAIAGVKANLAAPAGNTGDAAGDTYDSIENLTGSAFADSLTGDAKGNSLDGGNGKDTLDGGDGKDTLIGGAGKDKLYGGGGADHFVFAAGQTGATESSADTIYDFTRAQHDKIDLHEIDANTKLSGDQAFTFIGTAHFDHHAGELRYIDTSADTLIEGDINGDGKQDFVIRLHEDVTVTNGFFVL